MTKKITKENREFVTQAKEKIDALSKEQDKIFSDLLLTIGLEDEEDINWVFDYVCNTNDMNPSYAEHIEDTIFEN